MTNRLLDPDRLLPAETSLRELERDLYAGVKDLPVIRPEDGMVMQIHSGSRRDVNEMH